MLSFFPSLALAATFPDAPCRVVSSQHVELAAQAAGVLGAVLVDRGDRVHRGQLVAQLQADLEQVQLQQAEAHANSEGQLRARRAKLALTERAYQRNAALRAKNFISEQDLDQLGTDRDVASFDAQAAAEALAEARIEVQAARAALAVRALHSPIDGVVTERGLNPGERVGEKPVLVIERVDLLYGEAALPAALFSRLHVGDAARLQFSDMPGLAPRDVKIALIDPAVDGKSNTLGVRFDIANRDGTLPAGLKCRVELPGVP